MSDETSKSGDDGGKLLYCSFCGKSQHEVRKLIAGPSVFICDECVDLCNDIIREEVQESSSDGNQDHLPEIDHKRAITDWICYNACKLAQRVDAKAIITMSFTGYTGFKISSHRPKANIFVFTTNRSILNTLSMIWGVRGVYYDKFVSTDDTITDIKTILKKRGLVSEKDLVINITSMPIAEKGESNMLKLSYVK